MKRVGGAMLSFLLLHVFLMSVFAANEERSEKRIALVVDLSGSMVEYDPTYYIKEALDLAVGIAPDGSAVSVIGVNSDVVLDTGFLDSEDSSARGLLAQAIDNIAFGGNTNLVMGLQYAVNALDGPGRVILIADISEGGLTADSNMAAWSEQAESLTSVCSDQAVSVDLILLGEASGNEALAESIENIAIQSGGQILRPEAAAGVSSCIEELYFSSYHYIIWPVTGLNTSREQQAISLEMPTDHVHRARIYTPATSVQASYAGVGLEAQNQRTFSLLDLSRPGRAGLNLTVEPESGRADIYLITDYRLEAGINIISEMRAKEYSNNADAQQITTITIDILDQETKQSILAGNITGMCSMDFVLTLPDGNTRPMQAELLEGVFSVSFEPEIFGEHHAEITLMYNNQSIFYTDTWLEISALPAGPSISLSMTVAIVMGSVLIVAALLYAFSRKREKGENLQQAVQPVKEHGFSGKLQVSTVIAGGGETEVLPFHVELQRIEEGRLTLAELYESSGIVCPYAGCEKILFLPGPGESVVLKNNSKAHIFASGRKYTTGQKLQLHYNEKAYIIFEEDWDELEIYFRPLRASSYNSKKLSFSTM